MLADLLKKRCSVRHFTEEKITPDIIRSILEAGRLSPSGGNEQAWRFGAITDGELIKRIAEAAYGQKWIASAPLLIVLCTTIVSDERGGREIQRRRFPQYREAIAEMDKKLYSALNQEEHQTKIPGTHMVLQALEYGIGSTWVSYFDAGKVAGLLNLPELCIPSEILVFGYPAEERVPRAKKSLEELVFYNRFE